MRHSFVWTNAIGIAKSGHMQVLGSLIRVPVQVLQNTSET